MEIFSYVVKGALAHQDSLGHGRVLQAGQFQYMSAGNGIEHSEYNPSEENGTHFLQIWIQPKEKGGEPRYRDLSITDIRVPNALTLLASPEGENGSISIRQDAEILYGNLDKGNEIGAAFHASYPYAWIQVIKGIAGVGEVILEAGDGASIEGADFLISSGEPTEFLLFRLR
jgi:redox-sensitive bicupin YhaK (pirin superfamily)